MIAYVKDQTSPVTMLLPALLFAASFLGILLVFPKKKTCKSLEYVFSLISMKIIDLLDFFRQQNIFDYPKSFLVAPAAYSVFIFKKTSLPH